MYSAYTVKLEYKIVNIPNKEQLSPHKASLCH